VEYQQACRCRSLEKNELMDRIFKLSDAHLIPFDAVFAAVAIGGRPPFQHQDLRRTRRRRCSRYWAVNKAIDAASAAAEAPSTFAGHLLAGSIHLKSNVTLYLEQGSTVEASRIECLR